MNLVDVVNVGQGDCFIVSPKECYYNNLKFIIDLGNGVEDITKVLDKYNSNKYHLILTHSHSDHIGGFKYFIGSYFENIDRITLPLYQNEIVLIAKFLLNLRGMDEADNIKEIITYLQQLVSNQKVLKKANDKFKKIIDFAYDGKLLCNHIMFFNPININDASYNYIDSKDMIRISNCFNEKYKKIFEIYMQNENSVYNDIPEIDELIIKPSREEDELEMNINFDKKGFVKEFFIHNINNIEKFIDNPNRLNLKRIIDQYELNSNQASVVCKFNYEKSILFTGDVDKIILKQIINNHSKEIECDYLKVPHHGSKNNLNASIVKKINPEKAIISHNNMRFGRSKDSHPNKEVLDILKKQNVELIATNDIIKDGGVVLYKKKVNEGDDYVRVVECR